MNPSQSHSSYPLFCIGHPLIDIQVREGGKELLQKYELKPNDAILASDKHEPIYDEITNSSKHSAVYVAGGAAQNTARGAAYILPPNSVVFVGCVGDDDLAEQLKAANQREGVLDIYQVKKGRKTGACAVVITGHHRSLVTTLRVAKELDESHLNSSAVTPFIDSAKVFYAEGYMLTHNPDIILRLSQRVSAAGKIFALNFSAPYIPQLFNNQILLISPYCDIIITNEAEAEAWGTRNDLPDPKNIPGIAKAIALLPKINPIPPRLVIITHGAKATTVVSADDSDNARVYPVKPLADEEIVDTNAAGDAFVGGFLGAYVMGREVDLCVGAGHRLAAMCVGQVGPQYKWPKVKIL